MKVLGHEITDEQIAAGLAVMSGHFRLITVVGSLVRAGVPADGYVANRAANRLLQRERKAGRIEVAGPGVWTRGVSTPPETKAAIAKWEERK